MNDGRVPGTDEIGDSVRITLLQSLKNLKQLLLMDARWKNALSIVLSATK